MTRWRWPLAALVLLLCDLVLFAPICFQGRVLFFGDLSLYFIPMLSFERQELLAGRVALWNPYLQFGSVFVGNPQAWPLYPGIALLALFTPEMTVSLGAVIHVFLAAWGMLLFQKERGHAPVPAFLSALAFGFSGAVVSKAQFPNMLQAMAWLPWLFLAIEQLLAQQTHRKMAALAAVTALAILAAHPQVTMMQFYVGLPWVIVRLMQQPRERRWVLFRAIAIAASLGVLIGAAQWLPVVQATRDSTRPQLSLTAANRFYLPIRELTNFVLPNLYGNPATNRPWRAPGNFWEPCAYIGLIPLILAFLALGRLKRDWEVRFFAITALVGIWLALGLYSGLYGIAFFVLPGVKQFHDPARFLYIGTFGLAALAAHGAAALKRFPHWVGLVVAAVAAGDLLFFSATLNPTTPASVFAELAAEPAPKTGRVVSETVRGAWRRYISYLSYDSVRQPEGVAAFLRSGLPNLPLLQGIPVATAYEPVSRADIIPLLDAVSNQKVPLSYREPLAANMSASHFLVMRPDFTKMDPRPIPQMMPRATFETGDGSYRVLSTGQELPTSVPLVLPQGHPAGTVVLRDTNTPGWQVYIDGNLCTIEPYFPTMEKKNRIFRSVAVPEGAQVVEFRYDPTVWRVGLFFSLGGACILFTWILRRETGEGQGRGRADD